MIGLLSDELNAKYRACRDVLEPQKGRGLRGVEACHIIDGQQRLTPLQYFLAAPVNDSPRGWAISDPDTAQGWLWNANPETMERPERFKVRARQKRFPLFLFASYISTLVEWNAILAALLKHVSNVIRL